jgi:uncharacterized protein YoaH (UPF0181 family)
MSKFGDWLRRIPATLRKLVQDMFDNTERDWHALTHEQQQAIINGSQISELIKEGYKRGEDYLIKEATALTGLPVEAIAAILLNILQDKFGVNIKSIQEGLDKGAEAIENGLTSNGRKDLWQGVAKFAAGYLSDGKLDWVSLSLGVVEFAYRKFIKKY